MKTSIEKTIQFVSEYDNYAANVYKHIKKVLNNDQYFSDNWQKDSKFDDRHHTMTFFDISEGHRDYWHFEFVGPNKDNGDDANWHECNTTSATGLTSIFMCIKDRLLEMKPE